MQSDIFSTFGRFFRNEQLMRLSELRLPFRFIADDDGSYVLFPFQMELSTSQCFKLRRRVSPLSTANVAAENVYMLETSDGKFLSVTKLSPRTREHWYTSMEPVEFTVCDTFYSSPMTSCLFTLLPQPDGRVAIKSWSEHCEEFIRLRVFTLDKTYKFQSTDNLSDATKFLLAPEPEKQNEWCAEFGGLVGLQQLNRLQTLRLPFYLLAEKKMYRFYVKAQETHYFQHQGGEHYGTIEFQEEANTFTLHGGCADGTNCLLYASCGRYLCVVEHSDFGPILGTSPLMLDINDATPLPTFLFDFVPCSVKQTFSIRSHHNQMYLRSSIADEQKLCYYTEENRFPVDGTEKTATDFVLSPISISYIDNNKQQFILHTTTRVEYR